MRLVIILSTLSALGAIITFFLTHLKKQTQKSTPEKPEEQKNSSLQQTQDPSLKQDKSNATDERCVQLQDNQQEIHNTISSQAPAILPLLDFPNNMTPSPPMQVEGQSTTATEDMSLDYPKPKEIQNLSYSSAVNNELPTDLELQHNPLQNEAKKKENNSCCDDNFQHNQNENSNKLQYNVSKLSEELFSSPVVPLESDNSNKNCKALNNHNQQPADEAQQSSAYRQALEKQKQELEWLQQLEKVFGVRLVNTEGPETTPKPTTEESSVPDASVPDAPRPTRKISRALSVSSQSSLCPIRETDEIEEDEHRTSQNILALQEDGSLSPTSDGVFDEFPDDQQDVDDQLIDLQDDPDYNDIVSDVGNPNQVQNTSTLEYHKKRHCAAHTGPETLTEKCIRPYDEVTTIASTSEIVSPEIHLYCEGLTQAILSESFDSYVVQKCK